MRMLRALVDAGKPESAPHLAQAAGLSPRGARLVLESLQDQQIVKVHGSGRAQLYVLNEAHPLADPLSALFEQEQRRWEGLLATLRAKLAEEGSAVRAAWLYGSVSRGEDTPSSDVDVAAVVKSPAVGDRLRESLMALEDEQHVRISLTALTPKELAVLPATDRWWSDVVRDARVLVGPPPATAKRQATSATR